MRDEFDFADYYNQFRIRLDGWWGQIVGRTISTKRSVMDNFNIDDPTQRKNEFVCFFLTQQLDNCLRYPWFELSTSGLEYPPGFLDQRSRVNTNIWWTKH